MPGYGFILVHRAAYNVAESILWFCWKVGKSQSMVKVIRASCWDRQKEEFCITGRFSLLIIRQLPGYSYYFG